MERIWEMALAEEHKKEIRHSHGSCRISLIPRYFSDRLVNDRIPVDLFLNRIQIFIQSEKLDQERFFNSFIEEGFSFLPEGKNPIRGLDDVGIEDLGKSKKLSAFQGILEVKKEGFGVGRSFLFLHRRSNDGNGIGF